MTRFLIPHETQVNSTSFHRIPWRKAHRPHCSVRGPNGMALVFGADAGLEIGSVGVGVGRAVVDAAGSLLGQRCARSFTTREPTTSNHQKIPMEFPFAAPVDPARPRT